jgi:hypothetical protein
VIPTWPDQLRHRHPHLRLLQHCHDLLHSLKLGERTPSYHPRHRIDGIWAKSSGTLRSSCWSRRISGCGWRSLCIARVTHLPGHQYCNVYCPVRTAAANLHLQLELRRTVTRLLNTNNAKLSYLHRRVHPQNSANTEPVGAFLQQRKISSA